MKVILGITGSIAAYKSLELIRLLKKNGNEVRVILTASATRFVTPLSCQTLSEEEVYTEQFLLTKGIKHLSFAEWGDILVIAPATANIIAKASGGIGDDLLSTTVISFPKPILFVPAMDAEMWNNKIVQRNVKSLKELGYFILEPTTGALASGKIGRGRFPPVERIYKKILAVSSNYPSLKGKRILITGGRTEEDIDPVRVLTNRASGLLAKELYEASVCRDAEAKLIMGENNVQLSEDTDLIRVRTSKEMLYYLKDSLFWCDILIMAAAVGDYIPKEKRGEKIHSPSFKLELMRNPDLLATIRKEKGKKIFVGFSLEDKDALKRAREKIKLKDLDFIVMNPSSAIGSANIEASILKKSGKIINLGSMSKWELANRILDECLSISLSD
uniref:Coenzyme A biosynthesis bifunctional protein CoaBC n=1 Tax=candidate division WOR-3 bacterium TaxID=2052148 RepID=A0A7C4XIY5_UNCW3